MYNVNKLILFTLILFSVTSVTLMPPPSIGIHTSIRPTGPILASHRPTAPVAGLRFQYPGNGNHYSSLCLLQICCYYLNRGRNDKPKKRFDQFVFEYCLVSEMTSYVSRGALNAT